MGVASECPFTGYPGTVSLGETEHLYDLLFAPLGRIGWFMFSFETFGGGIPCLATPLMCFFCS
jgi:hypothetical protein